MSIIVYSSFQRKKINPFNARFKAYCFFLDAISKLSTSVNLKCVWLNEINSAYPKWWVSKCRSVKELVGEIENTCISLIERVRIWYELHINNFNNPSVYTHVPCLKRHFILLYQIEITQPSTFDVLIWMYGAKNASFVCIWVCNKNISKENVTSMPLVNLSSELTNLCKIIFFFLKFGRTIN